MTSNHGIANSLRDWPWRSVLGYGLLGGFAVTAFEYAPLNDLDRLHIPASTLLVWSLSALFIALLAQVIAPRLSPGMTLPASLLIVLVGNIPNLAGWTVLAPAWTPLVPYSSFVYRT